VKTLLPGCPCRPATAARALRRAIRLPALGLLCTLSAQGGELLSARFHIKPERPYVGQPFEIRLEIEVSPGAELQDLSLEGVPLDDCARLTPYQKDERRQGRSGERAVDVLSFTASGRPTQPVRREFSGILRALLVERHSSGFFSSVSTVPAAVRMAPLTVSFLPLPTANMPPGFQGAVGQFTLTGRLDPAQASPGDLVNLTCSVSGNGWMRDAHVLLSPPDPNFRIYPPQELQRDENGKLELRQVVVPLNTNATRIGVARFPYFDPVSGMYREATAGPFQLTLVSAHSTTSVPSVKHLEVLPNAATAADTGDAAVAVTISHARRLLPLAGVSLVAVLIAGLLHEWRPRLAIVAGLVLFAAGIFLCQRWSAPANRGSRDVRVLATARLCPSGSARVLFHIAPGRQVTPLERSGDWVRVDADGRRGWIPAGALADSRP
jgi:hypothetical protein